MKNSSTSIQIYFGLILALLIARIILIFLPVTFIVPSQKAALSWISIAIVAVLGFIGVMLSRMTGFPEIWDSTVSNAQKLFNPALIGLGFAGMTIVEDRIFHISRTYAAVLGIEKIHVGFPASVLVYPCGAIFTEITFRLFPIPFLVWLISNLILRMKWQEQVFWIVAVVTASFEPLGQLGGLWKAMTASRSLWVWLFIRTYAFNFISAYLFRRSGFLAPLGMRLSDYLLWHIVWGGLT